MPPEAFTVFQFTDSIEANVESAEVHVERGAVQLQKAAYYQVRLRDMFNMMFYTQPVLCSCNYVNTDAVYLHFMFYTFTSFFVVCRGSPVRGCA